MTKTEQMTAILNEMTAYESDLTRHINHFMKVWGFARQIGIAEGLSEEEQFVLEITALMHDIGIKAADKIHGTHTGPYQEKEGPGVARPMLEKYGFTEEEIERICYIIAHHHTYTDIQGLDYQILVEADFLVNLDEGKESRQTCENVKKNIFKTAEGTKLLDLIYLS